MSLPLGSLLRLPFPPRFWLGASFPCPYSFCALSQHLSYLFTITYSLSFSPTDSKAGRAKKARGLYLYWFWPLQYLAKCFPSINCKWFLKNILMRHFLSPALKKVPNNFEWDLSWALWTDVLLSKNVSLVSSRDHEPLEDRSCVFHFVFLSSFMKFSLVLDLQ